MIIKGLKETIDDYEISHGEYVACEYDVTMRLFAALRKEYGSGICAESLSKKSKTEKSDLTIPKEVTKERAHYLEIKYNHLAVSKRKDLTKHPRHFLWVISFDPYGEQPKNILRNIIKATKRNKVVIHVWRPEKKNNMKKYRDEINKAIENHRCPINK